MLNRPVKDGYVLVLRKGELLIRSLVEFCSEQQVKAGWLSGIGAVSAAEIGYYDLKSKAYKFERQSGFYEIVGLGGNISQWQGQIIPHLHIQLADKQLQTI